MLARRTRSATLRDCYLHSLRTAAELGAATVAFPLISAGVYHWPKQDAISQALTAMRRSPHPVAMARLVLFDDETYALAEQVRQRLPSNPPGESQF